MNASPYNRRVAELMSRHVVAASEGDSVRDALMIMEVNHVTDLPVVDRKQRCIGLMLAADVLELSRETSDEFEDAESLAIPSRRIRADFPLRTSLAQERVRDLMSNDVVTVAPTTTISEAARLMLRRGAHRVAVVDAQQRLVGILSTTDILRAFVSGDVEG